MPAITAFVPSIDELQRELDEIDSHHINEESALMVITEMKERDLSEAP